MKDLTRHLLKYSKRNAAVLQESCREVSTLTVERTPVDESSLRKSWTGSIGRTVKANNVDGKNGGSNDVANDLVIRSLKAGDTFNFANGQPYARRIEYDHHSPQFNGQGMVKTAVAEWNRIVRENVRKAK